MRTPKHRAQASCKPSLSSAEVSGTFIYPFLATWTQNTDSKILTGGGGPDGGLHGRGGWDNPSPGMQCSGSGCTGPLREPRQLGACGKRKPGSRAALGCQPHVVGSPQAVNPGIEAPRPENSNFLLSPLKMSWDTGIAVRVSLHALTARGTASPPSLVRADQLSSAPPRDPDAPPPKLLPPGSRRTTHARDTGHAHGHAPRSLNPAHSKFPSESAVRDKWGVSGSCINCTAHAQRALRGAGSRLQSSGFKVCGHPGE